MVQVTKQALVARIQRALKKDGQVLRASRSASEISNLGDFYIIDLNTNTVNSSHHKLVTLANELGCLKPFEQLAEF